MAGIAFCTVGLTATDALARFWVCNRHSETLWAALTSSVSTDRVDYAGDCAGSTEFGYDCGSSHFTAWYTRGWWRVEPGTCALVMGGDTTPLITFLHVETASRATLRYTQAQFPVRRTRFAWHSGVTEHLDTQAEGCEIWVEQPLCLPIKRTYSANFAWFWSLSRREFTVNVVGPNRAADDLEDLERAGDSVTVELTPGN